MSIWTTLSYWLIAIGGFIICMNWTLPFRYFILKQRGQSRSLIPLVGGVITSIGMGISRIGLLSQWFWVPLIVDLGCLPALIFLLWKKRKSREQ